MEELQDAIEDAQYVNAIATQDDGPRPVLPWEKPSEEVLAAWDESKRPHLGTVDWTLASPIGLFLFSTFLKEKHDDYLRINFCEDVYRFKMLRGRARWEKAQYILDYYLNYVEGGLPAPRTVIDEYDLERLVPMNQRQKEEVNKLMQMNMDYPNCTECPSGLKGPVRTEILNQLEQLKELIRITPKTVSMRDLKGPLVDTKQLLRDELSKEAAEADDEDTRAEMDEGAEAKPDVGKIGGIGNDISNSVHSNSATFETATMDAESTATPPDQEAPSTSIRSFRKSGTSSMHEMHDATMRGVTSRFLRSGGNETSIPESVFDTAEFVVMESLTRQYWKMFVESDEYSRLKNFLWYQDRRVVPDDFFVMRVLGRGGFGLVTGMYDLVGDVKKC